MSYTQSQSQSGQGAKLEICLYSTSPIVYVEVGELMSWSPSGKWELKDPTNLQSNGREKKPVLYDAGSVSTSVNRVTTNAGQTLLQTAYNTHPNPLLRLRMTLPVAVEAGQSSTGDIFMYTGYVTQFEPDVKVGDLIQNRFQLDFANFVSFTAGS